MQLKTRALLAVGCVSLLAISLPALGDPAPRGHANQARRIHDQRVFHPKKITHAPVSSAKPLAVRATDPAHLVGAAVVMPPKRPAFGWPALVREARKYMGTNPTARSRLWCATFMNLVLARLGYAGTNSDAALSFTEYGHRVPEPEIGAIAVLSRGRRGGHVGVVSGVDAHGNPIIISGNHGHRVGEGVYPRTRVVAYVIPTTRRSAGDTPVAARVKPIAVSFAVRTPNSPIVRRIPRHPRFEPVIDSPIAELLAAIEAEQNRPRAGVRPASAPGPYRLRQQAPERARQPALHAVRHDARRKRILAVIFGARARAASRQQRPVLQRGRLVSAYAGPTGRPPVPR
ncbi:MAG: TIGR02594 family protein [Pseudolabrys sp.]